MDVGELDRNKDKFLEYKTYFENEIARKSKHIKHTDDECHFVRYTVSEIFQKKQHQLKSPFLGLETPAMRIKNDNHQNVQAVWKGAIVIGHHFEKGKTKSRDAALDKCFYVFLKVIAKINADRRALRLVKFDLDNLQANPVLELFGGDRVGVRWEFEMNSQFDLGYYESDWYDVENADPQPPLATVTDGPDEIPLYNGDKYTCKVVEEDDGTLILKNTEGTTLATYTVAPGDEETRTAPDGEATVNGQSLIPSVQVPSGGDKNIEVVDTALNPVGYPLVTGKYQVPKGTVNARNTLGTLLGTKEVDSGGNVDLEILNVTHTQTDGTEVELAAGIGLTCNSASIPSLRIEVYLNAELTNQYVDGVDFGDSIWIHLDTDLDTPTQYRYMIFDQGLEGKYVVQAGETLEWQTRNFNNIIIYAEAVNATVAACALTAFEVEINADDDANAFITTHNALSGQTMGALQQSIIQGVFQRLKGTGTTYGSDLWTIFKNSGTRIFGYTPVDDSTVSIAAYGLDMIQLELQTFHGFIPSDFAVTGVTGGNSKYTKTGMYATDFGINELGGNAYIRDNAPVGTVFGATDGSNFFTGTNGMLMFIRTIAQNQVAVRANSVYGYISPLATRTGLIAMQRTSSSFIGAYRNGLLLDTVSVGTSSQNSREIYGHACNNNGTDGDYYSGEIAWLCPAMPSLTTNQMSDYYEVVDYYQSNIITGGRDV